MTSLGEKLFDRVRPAEMACFMPPYLAGRAIKAGRSTIRRAWPARTCWSSMPVLKPRDWRAGRWAQPRMP